MTTRTVRAENLTDSDVIVALFPDDRALTWEIASVRVTPRSAIVRTRTCQEFVYRRDEGIRVLAAEPRTARQEAQEAVA